MKVKPEHLEFMRAAISPLDTDERRARYRHAALLDNRFLSSKRYRWDLAHSAGLTPFFCKELYQYANDEHIDTALRAIVKDLQTKPLRD